MNWPKGRRGRVPLSLASACAALALVASCAKYQEQKDSAAPASTAPTGLERTTYVVKRGTIVSSVRFLGVVGGAVQRELFFKTGGRVRVVRVQRGDAVTKGEVLAELEIEDLKGRLAEAAVNQETAELRLEQATMSNTEEIAEAEIAVEQAQYRLAQGKAQDPQPDIAAAKAELDNAQAAVEAAKVKGTVTDLKKATRDLEIAQAKYQIAKQSADAHAYELLILGNELKLQQLALERVKRGPDPLLEKQVEAARIARESLEREVTDAQIVAPFSGVVVSTMLTEGTLVDAFRQGIKIVDPSKPEIVSEPDEKVLPRITTGQVARYTSLAAPGQEFRGKVIQVPFGSGVIEGSPGAEGKTVHIQFDPAARGKLDIGTTVQVVIEIERKDNVLSAPPQTIRTFAGRKFVIATEGERQWRIDVKTGIEGDDEVEIEGENLKEGMVLLGV